MLTPTQIEEFKARGVLRVERLLPQTKVKRAREALLHSLARHGLWRDGAWQLDREQRPEWPDTGPNAKRLGQNDWACPLNWKH